jgi:hypothetical protein
MVRCVVGIWLVLAASVSANAQVDQQEIDAILNEPELGLYAFPGDRP